MASVASSVRTCEPARACWPVPAYRERIGFRSAVGRGQRFALTGSEGEPQSVDGSVRIGSPWAASEEVESVTAIPTASTTGPCRLVADVTDVV